MSFYNSGLKSLSAAVALSVSLAGCAPDNRPASPPANAAESTVSASSATASASPFEPTPTGTAPPTDYAALLLQAGDLSDADDAFALRSAKKDPNGLRGATALFVNADDTRAISVTIAWYSNAAVATATLKQAISTANTVVTGGEPRTLAVGTGGAVIRGGAPDHTKAVTLVLFTQGNHLARLQFDSATGDTTTDQYVTDVAKMQQIALRVGIPDSTK